MSVGSVINNEPPTRQEISWHTSLGSKSQVGRCGAGLQSFFFPFFFFFMIRHLVPSDC